VIYALADDVLEEILEMKPSTANGMKLKLLMDEFSRDKSCSVPDPFYNDEAAFEPVFRMIQQGCEAILQKYTVKNH
jgi:protein-tyrosine phosphatase